MEIKKLSTTIDGLNLYLNKVVMDKRGVYCDMAPGGTDSPLFKDGIKHIHGSIATKKLVPRGGHYHYRLRENFYTLSGTALWYFYDFREDSPTYQKSYAVILGFEKPKENFRFPSYTIEEGSMAQIFIPPKVYHIFWPLSDGQVVVAGTGSLDYDPSDYARPAIEEVPGAKEIFEEIKEVFKISSLRTTETSEAISIKEKIRANNGVAAFLPEFTSHIDTGFASRGDIPRMKAIITAGRNAQLRPMTYTINKHLIPLANKPMIFYAIEHLVSTGFKEIGIVISPEDEELPKVVGNGARWNIKIKYILQKGGMLGLGHVIKVARDYLGDEPFILYLGDNIIRGDLKLFISRFFQEKLNCLLGLAKIKNPHRFGVPVFKNKKIIKIEERPMEPKSQYAVCGLYLYDKNVHKIIEGLRLSSRGQYEISDVHSRLIEKGFNVGWQSVDAWWKDKGKPEDILEGNRFVLEKITPSIKGIVEENVEIRGKVVLGEGSKILGHSLICGPVLIGKGCTIKDSYIGSFTSIGDRVEIYSSEIDSSLVMEGVHIFTPSRLTASLIGKNSSIVSSKNSRPSGCKIIVGENSSISL